jgi:hypothetical protein
MLVLTPGNRITQRMNLPAGRSQTPAFQLIVAPKFDEGGTDSTLERF